MEDVDQRLLDSNQGWTLQWMVQFFLHAVKECVAILLMDHEDEQ